MAEEYETILMNMDSVWMRLLDDTVMRLRLLGSLQSGNRVNTRMHYIYRNTWHALSTIASAEGPRGLFRGMGPTVLANAPFSALYYMFYTKMRHALAEELGVLTLPTMFLLDAEGKVVDRNLVIADLEKKLEEMVGQ